MFHRVKEVRPLPEYNLVVLFENGEQKHYDVKPLFDKWDVFRALTEVTGLFSQVKVDTGGYGINRFIL